MTRTASLLRPALLLAGALLLPACSGPARQPEATTTTTTTTSRTTIVPAPAASADAAPMPGSPDPSPAAPPSSSGPASGTAYAGANGLVQLRYAAPLAPGHDFGGKSLMSGGWRAMWDGSPPGAGTGVVSFAELAKPASGPGQVTELLRIGLSRDAGVVATCGTAGVQGPNTTRLPNRMLGGHRWTVWSNGDAGMSQRVTATDWRTVVNGVCYAIDRVSYAVEAAEAPPAGTPAQATAAARIDAVLDSVVVGGRP